MSDHVVDVLIAGQGAAAFSAALYAARYQISTMVAGGEFGGETAIGGEIQNYPGYPAIDGFDLMMKMKEQVDLLEVPIKSSNVASVEKKGDGFLSTLDDGTTIESPALILGIGRDRRKLDLPHEEELAGRGVSYCSTCDAPLYRNKRVVVVGGGNAAVEGAVLIGKYAAEAWIVYRREAFTRPEPILLKELDQSENVHQVLGTTISELLFDESGLTGVRLSRPYQGADVIECEGLFVEIGADPRVEIPKALGVELNPETDEVHVDRMMKTNVPGLFAAGDLTDASGSLKQTITAAGQGAIAALSAYEHVMQKRVEAEEALGAAASGD